MSKKYAVHICGYFGPDPGRDKKLKTAKQCLKRMAYCQKQGHKHRGTSMNMTWMYWYGEYGEAFNTLKTKWPVAFEKYMAEEEAKQVGQKITLSELE